MSPVADLSSPIPTPPKTAVLVGFKLQGRHFDFFQVGRTLEQLDELTFFSLSQKSGVAIGICPGKLHPFDPSSLLTFEDYQKLFAINIDKCCNSQLIDFTKTVTDNHFIHHPYPYPHYLTQQLRLERTKESCRS